MRVLLIGKGAREHALAYKISRSPLLSRLWMWPGNAAMRSLGAATELGPTAGHDELLAWARTGRIDLVVCGPEAPLAAGLADTFEAAGIPVFGPRKAAARLEASKAFAKELMRSAGIPTAASTLCTTEAATRAAADELRRRAGGAVIKASGLAAGKGVFVCTTPAEIETALGRLYHTEMRDSAAEVVVEEILHGRECSHFTFLGDGDPVFLGFAVDYKRLEDGDRGPNTGGMGCYAPVPWLPLDAAARVRTAVVEPLRAELARRGMPYRGCLYTGLMWHPLHGPQVVEFNVRLGDPEAQVLAAWDDRDWLAVIAAKCGLPVSETALAQASRHVDHGEKAVAVVMASAGYPFGGPTEEQGGRLDPAAVQAQGPGPIRVFAAAVDSRDGECLTTGTGRVLTVTGRARTFTAARDLAYTRVAMLEDGWPTARWRRDIGASVATEFG